MKVRDVMTEDLVIAAADDSAEEVFKEFVSLSVHGVPVLDEDGTLVGLVTSTDVVRALASGDWEHMKASDLAREPVLVAPDDDIKKALDAMAAQGQDRAVVVEDGKVVGVVTVMDVLPAVLNEEGSER